MRLEVTDRQGKDGHVIRMQAGACGGLVQAESFGAREGDLWQGLLGPNIMVPTQGCLNSIGRYGGQCANHSQVTPVAGGTNRRFRPGMSFLPIKHVKNAIQASPGCRK